MLYTQKRLKVSTENVKVVLDDDDNKTEIKKKLL